MSRIALSMAHRDAVVRARVGDLVELSLPDIPSGGYRWELLAAAVSDVLKLVESSTGEVSARVGGGATATWSWKVSAPGRAVLQLRRSRPWEPAQGDEVAFRATIEAMAEGGEA
jgi:inhibitor of cysteine peptidase